MKKILPLVIILAALAGAVVIVIALTGDGKTPANADGRPLVVTSVLPHAWLVEQIAGNAARVETMIPPGRSPATYSPTPAQAAMLEDADLYVKVGHASFPFEKAYMDKALEGRGEVVVVNAMKRVDPIEDDPHVWLSLPALADLAERQIRPALNKIDPANSHKYNTRCVTLIKRLREIKDYVAGKFEGIEKRKFLVYHPAWGYFARDFGLEQVSLEHDHKEPHAHDFKEFIDLANKENLKTVFVQEQFDTKKAAQVAGEIGGEVVTLDPLEKDIEKSLKAAADALSESMRE